MNSTNKTFNKWLKRIKDTKTPWTENEIKYFRKALGYCGLKDKILKDVLFDVFTKYADKGKYRITKEQDLKGKNYLLSKSLKLNGNKRKTNKLGDRELKILMNLKYHKFTGLAGFYNDYSREAMYYLPLYTAVARNGEEFTYTGTNYEQIQVYN